MCSLESYENISDMRKKAVIDSTGKKIGRIIDVVFDSNYNIKSFILGGSRWEEFRESLGIIDDIDPIIPAKNILSISKKTINIDLPKDQLHHKLEEGIITPTDITYSSMKRKQVLDYGNNRIGRICNLIFLPCGEVAFILSCNSEKENLVGNGFGTKWDLLLPASFIKHETINDITTNVRGIDLERTYNKHLLDDARAKEYLNSLENKDTAEMRALLRVGSNYFIR